MCCIFHVAGSEQFSLQLTCECKQKKNKFWDQTCPMAAAAASPRVAPADVASDSCFFTEFGVINH